MPTKEELNEQIDNSLKIKGSYSAAEVKHLINQVKNPAPDLITPNRVKVGDVFIRKLSGKNRPSVVLKRKNEGFICCSFTSQSDNPMTLRKAETRFEKYGYLSKSVFYYPEEAIKNNFVGIYDNNKDLTKLKRELKEYFSL